MLLRHFPTLADIEQAHKAVPDLYGPVPPFPRLRGNPQVESIISATTADIMPMWPLVADLVRSGQLLPHAAFVQNASWAQRALDRALTTSRIFFIEFNGVRYFPAFYLDKRYERRELEAICQALGNLPGGVKLEFFLSPKGSLNSLTPLEALARGETAFVRAAAEGFARG